MKLVHTSELQNTLRYFLSSCPFVYRVKSPGVMLPLLEKCNKCPVAISYLHCNWAKHCLDDVESDYVMLKERYQSWRVGWLRGKRSCSFLVFKRERERYQARPFNLCRFSSADNWLVDLAAIWQEGFSGSNAFANLPKWVVNANVFVLQGVTRPRMLTGNFFPGFKFSFCWSIFDGTKGLNLSHS